MLTALAAIVSSLAIWGVCYFFLELTSGEIADERRRFSDRLEQIQHRAVNIEKQRIFSAISPLNSILERQKIIQWLRYLLEIAGWKISPSIFILGSLLGGGIVFMITASLGKAILLSALLGIASAALPFQILRIKHRKYMLLFNEKFPKALQVIRGALGAGLGLSHSFQRASQDAPYPVRNEFSKIMDEMALGQNFSDAVMSLYRRVPIMDVRTFAVAISVQQASGSNIAELMKNLEETINARILIRKELRTLTAQARMSGWILALMPFCLILVILIISPHFFDPLLKAKIGLVFIKGAGGMMLIGILIIRKLINFKISV